MTSTLTRVTPTLLETAADCVRKAWFIEHGQPEPDRETQGIGYTVHTLAARFLAADERGYGLDGKPADPYAAGWDDQAETADQRQMASDLFQAGVRDGVIQRMPGSAAEFRTDTSLYMLDNIPLSPRIDYATPVGIQDHKVVKDWRWAKSQEKLAIDVAMLLYAKVWLEWRRAGGENPTEVEFRHNYFCRNPKAPEKTRIVAVRVPVENVEVNWRICIELAKKLRTVLQARHWTDTPYPDKVGVCNNYGGCPYVPICGKSETPEFHHTRVTAHNLSRLKQKQQRRSWETDEQHKQRLERMNGIFSQIPPAPFAPNGVPATPVVNPPAAGGLPPGPPPPAPSQNQSVHVPPAIMSMTAVAPGGAPPSPVPPPTAVPPPAPASAPTTAPAAPPVGKRGRGRPRKEAPVTLAAADLNERLDAVVQAALAKNLLLEFQPADETVPVPSPPWSKSDCVACGGRGFSTMGKVCRVCESTIAERGLLGLGYFDVMGFTWKLKRVELASLPDKVAGLETWIGISVEGDEPEPAPAPATTPAPAPVPVATAPAAPPPMLSPTTTVAPPTDTPQQPLAPMDGKLDELSTQDHDTVVSGRRPSSSFRLYYGAAQVVGTKPVMQLTSLLLWWGRQYAASKGAACFEDTDPFRRRDAMSAYAYLMLPGLRGKIVVCHPSTPDEKAFASALEPYAHEVVRATS